MRNSSYPTFDPDYAQDLKKNWPQIWKRGGNIEGNNQYRRLLPIVTRKDKKAQTKTEEMAIKKRESWAARHVGNFRLAGTVAQIKWFIIGDRGQSYMKKLINDEKKRLRDKRERDAIWIAWLERSHKPAEKRIQRITSLYLREAQERYRRRLKKYVQTDKSGPNYIIKSVLSWSQLLDVATEIDIIRKQIGKDWIAVWALAGNKQLDDVYRRARKERPLDLVFGDRDIAREAIDLSSFEIATTTAKSVKGIIEQGLLAGASINQISIGLDNATQYGMSRARMIARTESTKAINIATRQAYKTASNEGIRVRQQWLSSRDKKVRETHRELDGQIVDLEEMFIVPSTMQEGAGPAQFKDPAESINCRCTIVPVVE